MEITDKLLREIESLARLPLQQDERESLRRDLSRILDHFESLAELDLQGIEPSSHVAQAEPFYRDDEPRPGIGSKIALSGAAEIEDGHFRVPPIIGEEEHA
ncbi:Asp-tRNA(Asn)/Glu-tRNA(Gln) amidotransferase subunit GatC [bacterium]|nr:Asp-tRNA(Asn)/Glu-tRNA(Gln) amidotransferase subunit GatC [bacterium]